MYLFGSVFGGSARLVVQARLGSQSFRLPQKRREPEIGLLFEDVRNLLRRKSPVFRKLVIKRRAVIGYILFCVYNGFFIVKIKLYACSIFRFLYIFLLFGYFLGF